MINTRYNKSYQKRKRIGLSLSIISGLLLATNLLMITADAASKRSNQRRSMWSSYVSRSESKNQQKSDPQKTTQTQSNSSNATPPSTPQVPTPALAPTEASVSVAPAQSKVKKAVSVAPVSTQPPTPTEPSQVERIATLAATNPASVPTTSYSYKNFAPETTRILEGFASTAIAGGLIALIIQNLVIPNPATYRSSFVTVRG